LAVIVNKNLTTQPKKILRGIGHPLGFDLALFIFGVNLSLTLILAIWSTTKNDYNSFYSLLLTFSRLAAVIGTYLSLVGLILIARVPIIEKSLGHDKLIRLHRYLAPYALYLIFLHVLLVSISYAYSDKMATYKEIYQLITKYPWVLEAALAFILMITAGVTSYKKARKKLSYELWWIIHTSTYLALALGFMHQVKNGPIFLSHPLNKYYWIFLYLTTIISLLTFRLLIPLGNSLRYNLKVEEVKKENNDILSLIISGRNLVKLKAKGGQFFSWRFFSKGHWITAHPYSLSASPRKNYLRITVKDLGDHSANLLHLKKGTRVFIEGPYGTFVIEKAKNSEIILVAGGVGITPIRALLDEMPSSKNVTLLYRVSNTQELIFQNELSLFAEKRNLKIHYLVGSRKEHPMSKDYLLKLLPNLKNSEIYLCGPKSLVKKVTLSALEAGVPINHIHQEEFEYHAK